MLRRALRKGFERDVKLASKMLMARGQLSPMFIFRSFNGQLVPVLISGGDKDANYKMLRLFAVAKDAEAVTSFNEGWTLPPAVLRNLKPGEAVPLPSAHAERVEVISVGLVTREYSMQSMRKILRNADGHLSGLGPEMIEHEPFDAAKTAGALFSILPPERPSSDDQALARMMLEQMQQPAGHA